MEDINNRSSTAAIIGKIVIRPRLLIQALAFTGILYFCVGQAPPKPKAATNQLSQTRSLLSPSFENDLLQHASKQLGLPTSALRITHAQSQTWSDNCLGIRDPEIFCTQTPVPGWQIEVASDTQTWVYRTNATGSVIKIDLQTKIPRNESKIASEDAQVSCETSSKQDFNNQTLAKGI